MGRFEKRKLSLEEETPKLVTSFDDGFKIEILL